MAQEVLDVVTRFTYDVQDEELIAAGNAVKANINNINVLTAALQKQQAAISNTSRLDIQKRKEQQAAINATKAAIDKETKALETNILSNKKLQQVISTEIGLIGKLQTQMDVLRQKRDLATDATKIRNFSNEISKIQGQISGLTSGKSAGGGIGSGILQGLGLGGGFAIANLAVQGIGQIKEFINESSRLAAETEGVQRAFQRLDSPGLLDNLRAATKGTVSDLELMKSAVQFSNFGLPVSKLATGLEFARIRAKETGQSVDYLVNSITTGIGRQSPLILDNLGINARRVREEFQKTGDFAEAAFKIIQEESAKAGIDIETFTEKQQRLNATIENQQAKFGTYINQFKGYLLSIGEDLFNELEGTSTNLTGRYLQDIRDLRQNAQEVQRIQSNTDALFLQDFQVFADKFKNANFQTRQDIKDDAKIAYDQLLANNKAFYGEDQEAFDFYAKGLKGAYQRLLSTFSTTKVDLKKITGADLVGYSKDQLEQVQEQINVATTSLTSKDSGDIQFYKNLREQVQKNLDVINGTVKKATKEKKQEPAKQKFSFVALGIDDESFNELNKRLDELLLIAETKFGKLTDNSKYGVVEPFAKAGIPNAQDDAAQTAIRDGIRQAQIEKENADKQQKIADERRATILETIDLYQQLSSTAVQAFNAISEAQQQQLALEISARERRVDAATKLAERGNTEVLKIEQERLEEAERQQAEAAKRTAAINAALTLSYAIAGAAKAALEGGVFAPITIAAYVAALVAGYAAVKVATAETGFAEGGYTGDGTKHEKAGTVHKGEFVFTKEKTAQHRDLFEAIHTGKINQRSLGDSYASTTDVKGLESRLDALIEATEGSSTKVNARVDERGVAIITERYRKQQIRKWS